MTSRRGLLVYASLGALGLLAAPGRPADHSTSTTPGGYWLVDQRQLAGGGLGLFIAVAPDSSTEQLRILGELLERQFRSQPNLIVEVFDDAEAARRCAPGRALWERNASVQRVRTTRPATIRASSLQETSSLSMASDRRRFATDQTARRAGRSVCTERVCTGTTRHAPAAVPASG